MRLVGCDRVGSRLKTGRGYTDVQEQQRRWERVFTPTLPPFLPPPKRDPPFLYILLRLCRTPSHFSSPFPFPGIIHTYTSGEALLLLLCILEWRKGKTATVYSVAQHHAPTQMSSLFRLALNIFGSQLGVFFRRSLYNLFVFFFSLIPDGSLSTVTPKLHTFPLFSQAGKFYTATLFWQSHC
jgi:hypothetical protein